MSVIHQLYCTHCTYRTSALHRRDDSIGDQVFEYSTRAGSVPREKSHDVFRLIEPALYFHLPGDTPQTEFMRFTANTAPRRLFFLPAISGTRVVAHVCYRQTDTRGRPGSYFAHVFSSENKSGANWSALDAIMLWGSPNWVTEDSANLPDKLDPVESLTTIPGHGTHINESVLRSFLTTPVNGFFSDPGKVIPPQWRERDPQQRRQLLIDLLSAALCVEVDRHEKVWLAAEESFAALLFYGVFRLLPPKGLADKLSFSTFEAHTDRPSAVLVATRFHKPETDFAEDAYKGRGVVINTFNGRRSLALRPAVYAATVVQRFLAPDGSRQVNELLQRLAEANVSQGKELEQLLAAEELIPQIVSPPPGVTVTERQLPSGREARKIVQRGVVKALYAGSVFSPQLRPIAQSPERVSLLIELLSGSEIPEAEAILRQLLQFIPTDGFVRLMPDKRISRQQKLDLLAKVVRETKSLPPGYESLWSSRPELGWPDKLLEGLFSQLSCDDVRPLLDSAFTVVPGSPTETMDRLRTTVSGLLVASASDPAKRDLLPPIVERLAAEPSRLQSFLLMKEIGAQLVSQCGLVGPIETCLRDTLQQLPREPGRFVERLSLLQVGQNLPLGEEWITQFNAWQNIRRRLGQVNDLAQNPPSRFSLSNKQHQDDLESRRQGLLGDAPRALPFDDFPDDHSGRDRAKLLNRIVDQLLPSESFPAGFLNLEQLAAAISRRPYQVSTPTTRVSTPRTRGERSRVTSVVQHPLTRATMVLITLALVVRFFAPELPSRLYNNLAIFVFGEPNEMEEGGGKPTGKEQVQNGANEPKKNGRAEQEKMDKDKRARAARAEQEKKEGNERERIARVEREKREVEEQNRVARAEQVKKDEKEKARLARAEKDKKAAEERALAEGTKNAAHAKDSTKWPPKFLTLPPGEPPELNQLCPWGKEPSEPIVLRGIDELNAHLATFVGDQPRPMFVVGKDETIGSEDKPLIVKWAAKRPADESQPAATVELCRFQKTAEGLYFRWNRADGDSLHKAQQMLRLCCLEIGQGEKAVLTPLLADSDLLENWNAEYKDNAALFTFKLDLPGAEAFTWTISRGRLHMKDGDVHDFKSPRPDSVRSNIQEFKWSDKELAQRLGFGNVEFNSQVVTKPASQLRVFVSVDGNKNAARQEPTEYQKNFSELSLLLRKVLNEPLRTPYKNSKGKPTASAPTAPISELTASDFNYKSACQNWSPELWIAWTEDMNSVMRRLSPDDWTKPERPTPLVEDPKLEPVQRAGIRYQYVKDVFSPWAIRELIYPAVQFHQSKLAQKQEVKSDSGKAKDFPNGIDRVEINELVRYVNLRPVVSLKKNDEEPSNVEPEAGHKRQSGSQRSD